MQVNCQVVLLGCSEEFKVIEVLLLYHNGHSKNLASFFVHQLLNFAATELALVKV